MIVQIHYFFMKSDILNIDLTNLIHRIDDSINGQNVHLKLQKKNIKCLKCTHIFGRFPCKKLRFLVTLRIEQVWNLSILY